MKLTTKIKQEAPLPLRAQRIHRALLVYFMTFLRRESLMANQLILRNRPRKLLHSAK